MEVKLLKSLMTNLPHFTQEGLVATWWEHIIITSFNLCDILLDKRWCKEY